MPLLRPLVCLLAAACVLGTAPALHAAPGETESDPMLGLIHQRGLLADVPAQAQTLVRQVRETASDLVVSAMGFLGLPYRRGGSDPERGFDCSGFTRHIFENTVGLVLPRRADQQARDAALHDVARDDLKPGDLVFFNTMRRAFSHVGIYVGDGKFIHSPRSGGEVRVEDMRHSYWARRYNGARRADLATASDTARP